MDSLENIPSVAKEAVLLHSSPLPQDTPVVSGYEWNNGIDYSKLLQTYIHSGFQSTSFGLAIEEINRMLDCREIPLSGEEEDKFEEDEFIKRRHKCTIFLGYTSNMVSCGLRETLRWLVEHRMVDCIVTTAGGVEEDLIKCLAPTYLGDFSLDGRSLREKGINRIGNLLVPNDNYCKFEDWVMPLLDEMVQEQITQVENQGIVPEDAEAHLKKLKIYLKGHPEALSVENQGIVPEDVEAHLKKLKIYLKGHPEALSGIVWSPSKVIEKLGLAINDKSSICYWAAVNKIPIFSPALTDGSLGDMMYFHSYKKPGLVLDILQDLRRLNSMSVKAVNSGMMIIGGGVVKHHICNANLMRNGADYSVFLNTASEYDGSDSGARPDEAISWGKIKKTAKPVKIYAEASLIFPLLVGETFAKRYFKK